MIKKFLYFFDKKQKRALSLLLGFMFIATILEMLGLGFIFSILGALSSENLKSSLFIGKLSFFFNLDEVEIISYLLLAFLFFYIIKITFLIFYNWYESSFLYLYKEKLSSNVFKEYLNQNFSYFYDKNSSEFIRNLITEIDQFIIFLVNILRLALEIVVVVGIFCLLAYFNFYFTVLITLTFLFFSLLYFALFKKKIRYLGKTKTNTYEKKDSIHAGRF